MSWSVGNNELALIGTEVAICHINSDTLFAFCFQSVQQESIVNLSCTCISYALGIAFQCLQLILIKFFAVKKETAYQGGFTIINRTRSQKAEERLTLICIKEFLNIYITVCHNLICLCINRCVRNIPLASSVPYWLPGQSQ